MQQTTATAVQKQKVDLAAQLAAGMAHEINTPVQYIGDNLRFLKDAFHEILAKLQGEERHQGEERFDRAYLQKEIPEAIDQALEGVSRVAKLVSALQEFSQPGTEVKIPLNLNHVVESTMLVSRNEWKYVAEVKLELDAGLPRVMGHAGEINQVVYSLMVQVAQAMASRQRAGSRLGLIRVQTRREGVWVVLLIEDAARATEEQPKRDCCFTWESFAHGGPGLSIARSVVVERHQGTLDFETREVQGGRFIVRLPGLLPV